MEVNEGEDKMVRMGEKERETESLRVILPGLIHLCRVNQTFQETVERGNRHLCLLPPC